LNLSKNPILCKEKPVRLKPNHREGLRIQYWLKDLGKSFVNIGLHLETSTQIIADVVFGRRHSARIETEIARILGKADWNEVVLEARSAQTGKSIEETIDDFAREIEAREQTASARFANREAIVGPTIKPRALTSRKRRAG
jgi:hypothetical protein